MANTSANAAGKSGKKMEYRKVSYDVNEIAPDAPAGEWMASIPRGKCKVQPTKEDRYPMLIVPVRLDSTDEDGDQYEKALGVELSTMIVFFDNDKPRAARMGKLKLIGLCEAADVDLDLVPKEIGDDPENELEPLIRALEGKKFKVWTVLETRKDTGEVTTELRFQDPKKTLASSVDEDDDDDNDGDGDGKSSRKAPAKKAASSKGRSSKSNRR